ncbi:MAG: sulfatase-like hydrolase/transferase [Verrucomicrobiae bacterium]|nr:sulfatase-like hydrolase/transferase [Verrucomicrobiae bacterium]
MKATCTLLAVLLLVPLTTLCAADPGPDKRPNIIVILADDFGVGDIQSHYPDNKIATPNLDRLVSEGMSFTDAHSPSAVCSPTRYGLLAGRYAWRTRLQEWVVAAYEPPLIDDLRPTLPGFLREHGYHAACIGKWHLGWNWVGPQPSQMTAKPNGQKNLKWDFEKPVAGGPVDRGFDHFFGVDLPNLPPFTWIENDHVAILPTEAYQVDPEEGIALPVAFNGSPSAPGWRLQAILPEITKRAVDYIHDRAEKEEPFFLYFAQTSPHEPVVPSAAFRGKSGIAPVADFVMETDWSAGQVMEAVEEAGIADNTLVVFTADNGHSHYTGWDDLIKAGHQPSGPYRGHKGDIWEGGHRVPLVVRWPGKVAAGSASDRTVSLTDLFATFAGVVGDPLPADGAEDSISFLPDLLGEGEGTRTGLVSHSNMGEFALRDGSWKIVYRMAGKNVEASRGQATIAELYDLEHDIAEANNLADQHPDIVATLTAKLNAVIHRGATRENISAHNDCDVDFRKTQTERWAPVAASDTTTAPKGFTPLFDGKTWANWDHPAHLDGVWEIADGVIRLRTDEPPREKGRDYNLATEKHFKDFTLMIDWRLTGEPHVRPHQWLKDDGTFYTDAEGKTIMKDNLTWGDSGIYLRGARLAQVNIWCQPCGSGEVGTKFKDLQATQEERLKTMPSTRADKGLGEWNRFVITLRVDRVDVSLNGAQVIQGARVKDIPAEGPITLQNHKDAVEFRNIFIQEITRP